VVIEVVPVIHRCVRDPKIRRRVRLGLEKKEVKKFFEEGKETGEGASKHTPRLTGGGSNLRPEQGLERPNS
jgi:hypothetical protein